MNVNNLRKGKLGVTNLSSYTVTLRFGQLSPKVPPCSLKVMRFHTAIMVSSGTLKWNSSTLAKDLKALSLRGVRVKYSVTKRQSAGKKRTDLFFFATLCKINIRDTGEVSYRKLERYLHMMDKTQGPIKMHAPLALPSLGAPSTR